MSNPSEALKILSRKLPEDQKEAIFGAPIGTVLIIEGLYDPVKINFFYYTTDRNKEGQMQLKAIDKPSSSENIQPEPLTVVRENMNGTRIVFDCFALRDKVQLFFEKHS